MRLLNSCRFHTFYKILRTLKVLEKVVQFSCSQFSQTEHFIQSLFFSVHQFTLHYLQQSLSSFLSALIESGL